MRKSLTIKRLDILRTALCHYEIAYEGEENPPHGFTTWDKFNEELAACHAWVNRTQGRRIAAKHNKEMGQ